MLGLRFRAGRVRTRFSGLPVRSSSILPAGLNTVLPYDDVMKLNPPTYTFTEVIAIKQPLANTRFL